MTIPRCHFILDSSIDYFLYLVSGVRRFVSSRAVFEFFVVLHEVRAEVGPFLVFCLAFTPFCTIFSELSRGKNVVISKSN